MLMMLRGIENIPFWVLVVVALLVTAVNVLVFWGPH